MNNLEKNETELTLNLGELVDIAPDYAKEITGLVSWATNYEDSYERNPLNAFLLLIGWASELEMDTTPYEPKLSWLELDLIGNALVEYSARPLDCRDWLKKLLQADN